MQMRSAGQAVAAVEATRGQSFRDQLLAVGARLGLVVSSSQRRSADTPALELTHHAAERMAARSIPLADITLLLEEAHTITYPQRHGTMAYAGYVDGRPLKAILEGATVVTVEPWWHGAETKKASGKEISRS